MADGFQFKQFFIAHDRCAMKVNTDGILLGAIADVQNADHILDLGTGTGLIAIMLAQRSNAEITAVELEPNAYQQAVENSKNSAFSDRLQVIHTDVFKLDLAQKFDLIVANPPYFSHSPATKSSERDLARTATQNHLDWLIAARHHLNENGKISVILPFDAAQSLIEQSPTLGLYCVEQWHISPKSGKPPKRMVATFSPIGQICKVHSLAVYDEHNQYHTEFKQLTQAFYLHF